MEIAISKKGDLHILAIKGKIRLQNWRIVNKHLETLLAKSPKCLVMDLNEVTLICSTGVGAILHNIEKFKERNCRLVIHSTAPVVQEIFQVFGCNGAVADTLFPDWDSLATRLRAQGMTVSG